STWPASPARTGAWTDRRAGGAAWAERTSSACRPLRRGRWRRGDGRTWFRSSARPTNQALGPIVEGELGGQGSNRRQPAPKAGVLPTELPPMGRPRLGVVARADRPRFGLPGQQAVGTSGTPPTGGGEAGAVSGRVVAVGCWAGATR